MGNMECARCGQMMGGRDRAENEAWLKAHLAKPHYTIYRFKSWYYDCDLARSIEKEHYFASERLAFEARARMEASALKASDGMGGVGTVECFESTESAKALNEYRPKYLW